MVKKNKIMVFHFLVLSGLFLINFSNIFNLSLFKGFSYGDSEVAGFIAYILGKGGKLYQDFSIVYGPGRFIVLAGLNKLFGVDISIPLFSFYSVFISRVLVTYAIYWLTYRLLWKKNKYWRLLLGLAAGGIYYLFLRSGQDTHLIILLFLGFYVWSKQNQSSAISAIAGLLLGLIGFFRIESGIFALMAVLIAEFFINGKKIKLNKPFFVTYLVFQLFYFLLILLNGSLGNFFHDVVQMGVIAQPKLMKILIQAVDYPLFEFFLILNIFSVLVAFFSKRKELVCLSVVNLLGFANALGRADFDHLYYGLAIFAPTFIVSLDEFIINWKSIISEKISFRIILLTVLLIMLQTFTVKRQMPLLQLVIVLIVFLGQRWLKKGVGVIAVFFLIMAFQTMVRSQSLFTFYLKRQLEMPQISNIKINLNQINSFSQEAKKGNYGGFQLSEDNKKAVDQMKKDIGEKSLFIYPSYATLYAALSKTAPIRYLYFNNEYTKRMEDETIKMLADQKIEYVLMSVNLTNDEAVVPNQTKRIQGFINKNYKKEKEYFLGGDRMILLQSMLELN